MTDNRRKLVEDVLGRDMTREIWSGLYDKALPVSLHLFELSAVLPAVFYMFRFGHRRGTGQFLKTFGSNIGTPFQQRRSVTIERVAGRLADVDGMTGFDGEIEKAILGDLLLCACLENEKHSLGRDEQIQRVAPAHYMASWIDLPRNVSNLRFVPEMIVAMLANQEKGDVVQQNEDEDRTWFAVGKGYKDNVLLHAFSRGVTRRGEVISDLASDRFEENDTSVGLDQLLMIRLAQELKSAPSKMRGDSGISNQRPVSKHAARHFSEDIRRFLRSYASQIPRHALVEMLESCIAVGMTTILTSTVEILFRWAETGTVPDHGDQQRPAPLFVDCSNGVDRYIRAQAEQSMDDVMRRMERFPVMLMVLRLLDHRARNNRNIKKLNIPTRPYATDWINLLGDLLHERHEESERIHNLIDEYAARLNDKLEDMEEDYSETTGILSNTSNQMNSVWRLADGLMTLMAGSVRRENFVSMIDSSLLTGRPNGLAAKRATTRDIGSGSKKRDVRSIIFTDPVIEYLVHLHLLRPSGKPGARALPFKDFIGILRERYGLHVDAAPPGMTISNELLQRNRAVLERRLRDLGLLIGVNDAEAMKRLRPRFETAQEH